MCCFSPQNKIDGSKLNTIALKDTDFDGDEIELVDFWQAPELRMPKDALKHLGMKITFDEQGEAEISEREGAEVDAEWLLKYDHDARVAAIVADLLDDDEDEAELPALAMRRPAVYMAAAVGEWWAGDGGLCDWPVARE